MKKGIIACIFAVICFVVAGVFPFASPKVEKTVKMESTTEASKETTTEVKKTTEKKNEPTSTEVKEVTEENDDVDVDDNSCDLETDESEDSTVEEDNEEIDDEQMDKCDHEWSEPSYAIDPETETGYVITQDCKKCHLVKDTPISFEEYEEATKDQEPDEKDCVYEDNDDAEVVE